MKPAAAAVVLLLVLAPSLYMIGLSIGDPGYREVLSKERQGDLLWRSVWISGLATLMAVFWGALVARGVRALRGAAASVLEAAVLVPLLLPSVVMVMGWVYFTGPNGPVAALFGGPLDVFRPGWAAVAMSFCYFPVVALLLLQAYRTIDPAWSAVARMHAGRLRTFRHVSLPLTLPYAATAGLLVFLLCFGDYAIPWALSVNIYPVEIFSQMSAYFDVPKAMAFCTPPLAIAFALVASRHLFIKEPPPPIGHRSHSVESRPSRWWLLPASLVLAAAVALPLTMLVVTTGNPSTLPESLTIAGDNAMTSLATAAIGCGLLLVAGAVLGIALSPANKTVRAVGSSLVLLPLVIPGAAVGLGIVMMYRNDWIPVELFRSEGILAYGMLCRLVSFPALILAGAFGAIQPRMVQAAALAGVGPVRTWLGVTLRLALPGLIAATMISFILCLGELAASILISPPGVLTLSMRISSLLHFGEDRIVAALSLTLAGLALGVFLLGSLVLNRRIDLNLDANTAR